MSLPLWDHTHNIIEQPPSIMWAYDKHILLEIRGTMAWIRVFILTHALL